MEGCAVIGVLLKVLGSSFASRIEVSGNIALVSSVFSLCVANSSNKSFKIGMSLWTCAFVSRALSLREPSCGL